MTMHERQHVAPEIEEHENIKDYLPFAIQTTSLIALIILTSCLITLLEVLRHVLPTRPPDSITYVIGNGYPWTITTAPAVVYACLWLAVDYNVMRMEPFYQFAEPQEDRTGLNDSLTFSYITCNALTIPLHALKRKHWAVFYSSLSHLVASIALPIVVTEMVGFEFDDRLPIARVRFYPTYYWITIGLLATVVILTGALIKTLWSRRSGVKADPSSIVGLAITFAGTDSLAGLRLLKAQTPPQSANLHLFHSRHINETIDVEFHNQGGKIVAQQPLLAQAACSSNPESKLDLTELAVEDDPSPSPLSSMITSLRNSAGLIILPLLLLAIVITLSGSETRVMNDWLVNPDHIVQPVLILISTLIKSLWTTIERDAQISEPFIRLAKHSSGSEKAVLASVYGSPFGSFFISLRHGYMYPVAIAFTALLAEINTIFLPSVLWTYDHWAFYLTFAISIFMLFIWCWVCWRARKRVLPKSPETIAGALSYLYESRLPHFLQHMKSLDDKERREAIRSLDREYDLTPKAGSDGVIRWTIDFRD